MVVLVPLIVVHGPLNTAPVDFVNAGFVAAYWAWLVARRERITLPFLLPLWLILLGSLTGTWAAPYTGYRLNALLTTMRGVYLYVWFITAADFFARTRRLQGVVTLWAGVAAVLGLAALADQRAGLAGGVLLESAQRARGSFENPNMFGDYLVVSFFLAWAAAAGGRRRLYLALPALAGGVLATGSNGALFGLLGGSAATLGLARAARPQRRIGVLLVTAGVLLAVILPLRQRLADAAADAFSRERGELGGAVLKGYQERVELWSEALAVIRRFPVGAGPGNFDSLSGQVAGAYNSMHNDYLGMLAERGPLGLLGWCGFLVSVAGLVGRVRRGGDGSPLAWTPLAGLVAAVGGHALVVELFHFRHVWLAFAVVAAAAIQATGAAPGPAVVVGRVRPAALEAA
jgi:O-antigen ligase